MVTLGITKQHIPYINIENFTVGKFGWESNITLEDPLLPVVSKSVLVDSLARLPRL